MVDVICWFDDGLNVRGSDAQRSAACKQSMPAWLHAGIHSLLLRWNRPWLRVEIEKADAAYSWPIFHFD